MLCMYRNLPVVYGGGRLSYGLILLIPNGSLRDTKESNVKKDNAESSFNLPSLKGVLHNGYS